MGLGPPRCRRDPESCSQPPVPGGAWRKRSCRCVSGAGLLRPTSSSPYLMPPIRRHKPCRVLRVLQRRNPLLSGVALLRGL